MRHSAAGRLYALVMFLVVSVLCGVLTAGLAVPGAALVGGTLKVGADSMTNLPASFTTPPQAQTSKVLMADGRTLATFYDTMNRTYVPLSKISQAMQSAQVAIEDHRFFEHGAIDVQGTARAFVRDSAGGSTQGGSTLTQQYVKQVQIQQAQLAGDEVGVAAAQAPTINRKVKELRYAIGVEKQLTKKQVLERYLNIAYYGDGAYGVQAAAQHYFHINASQLNLAQAALLAGMVQTPSQDPVNHTTSALARRNVVLNRMLQLQDQGELWGMKVTAAEVNAAKKVTFDKSKVTYVPTGCTASPYPVVCDYVEKSLLTMPALGKTADERRNMLYRGGLTIRTLIDPKAQDAAQKAINGVIGFTDPVDAGTVVIRPSDGLIVTMAQNRPVLGNARPAQTNWNYNVPQSLGGTVNGVQAGSTFKAITIAAALNKGIPATKTFNSPSPMDFSHMAFPTCAGSVVPNDWKPVKNSVAGFDGVIDMYRAAQGSVNTYFIQLERQVGLCDVTKMAAALGVEPASGGKPITDGQYQVPSFTLGTIGISPLSMAVMEATFANRGKRCAPRIVASVTTSAGKSVPVPGATCTQVIDPSVADGVADVLGKVMEHGGTGYRARIPGVTYQAGKTGTTEDNNATWFAGFTPQMAGIAWLSISSDTTYFGQYWTTHRRTLKNYRPVGGQPRLEGSGSGDAGRIYKSVMAYALQGLPDSPFQQVSDSTRQGPEVTIPSVSGLTTTAARQLLESYGLQVNIIRQRSQYPRGWSLGYTYPAAGAQVPANTPVTLYVSSGRYSSGGTGGNGTGSGTGNTGNTGNGNRNGRAGG